MANQSQPGAPEQWLILSHAFNMDGRAASLTVTDKLPWLVEAGIEPIIVSAVTGARDSRFRHLQLLPWGPSGLRFDLRHYLAMRLGRGAAYRILMLLATLALAPFIVLERLLAGHLQSQWSWCIPATLRSWFLIRRHRPALVYSAGSAYSAHIAGYFLKRLTGIRWIAEVHDPMVQPGTTPRTRDQRLWAWVEGRICDCADLAWWFTDGALASALARHPGLGERGLVVLPGANPPGVDAPYRRGPKFVFAHFGSLSATRSLQPFLDALAAWLHANPQARGQIALDVYGTQLDADSVAACERHGLQDIVRCFGRIERDPRTGRSGREQVSEKMHQADCLLAMHGSVPECSEYIPSKMYDYFWAKRPVLALTHRNAQLDRLVAEHGGTAVDTLAPEAIVRAIGELHAAWQAGAIDQPVSVPPIGVDSAVRRILQACDALPDQPRECR